MYLHGEVVVGKPVRPIQAVAAILVVVGLRVCSGQEPEEVQVPPDDAQLTFGENYFDQAIVDGCCDSNSQVLSRFPTHATYLKAGTAFALGDGFFENDSRVGFALEGGWREFLLPEGTTPYFLDVGGSLITMAGRGETRVINGESDPIIGGAPPTPQIGAFESTLTDLRRVAAHAALGYYFQPIEPEYYQLLFTLRFGGRWGHVSGLYERVQIRDDVPNDTRPTKDVASNDTFGGIFLSLEMALVKQEFFGGDIAVITDFNVVNDWIDLVGLQDDGFPTASVMFGVTMRR